MALAVQRALALLRLFTQSRPEIGLSEAARLTGESKATVYRLFGTLCESGLVEQVEGTKTYRLGPAVLDLARVREATVPLLSVVQPVLDDLLELTGETCHFTQFNGQAMAVVATAESRKVHRITMQGITTLPLDTTAAGVAFLAFASPAVSASVLQEAARDAKEKAELEARLELTRARGYSEYEFLGDDEAFGVAAPVFRGGSFAFGSLAVVVPPHRMQPALFQKILQGILAGSKTISMKIGSQLRVEH